MMNKLCFFLALAALLIVSCGDGAKKSYWDNGKLKSVLHYRDGKLNGECVWYYANGNLQMQADFCDDLKNGHSLRWYENGCIAEDCWYKKGVLDSIYRSYSVKGILALEEYYVGGERNGQVKKWFENGQIFQEGQYVGGMMDGLWLVFYPSGTLAAKAEYRMGTGKQTCYDESGYKCLDVPYVNNVKHGKEIYYNPDGRITKIVEYENGNVVFEDNDPQNIGQ